MYDSYAGYTGVFQITYHLDSMGLTDLRNDSLLNFLIGTNASDVNFLLAELTVETSSAPVPEPATMLLLTSGLLGLAGMRRIIKK